MGKVSGNWVTGVHSGRACNHESIYTRVNRKTGACYSAKLCNPNTDSNDKQLAVQAAFSIVSKDVADWIKENKESNSAEYKKIKMAFDRQKKYSTLRGFIIAKGKYTVASDKQSVTVSSTAQTDFKTAFGIDEITSDDDTNTDTLDPTQARLTLSASPTNGGTVSGGGVFTKGSSPQIVATPADGYYFSRWSDGNTDETRNVTMDENKALVAYFNVE